MSQLPAPNPKYPSAAVSNGQLITPSDNLLAQVIRRLYVGGTGDLTLVMNDAVNGQATETFNPATSGSVNGVLSNGNLTYTANSNLPPSVARVHTGVSTGKFYAEFTLTNPQGTGGPGASIALVDSAFPTDGSYPGISSTGDNSIALTDFSSSGIKVVYNGGTVDFNNPAAHLITGDVIGLALDLTSTPQTLSFYQNGTLIHTTNLTSIGLGSVTWFAAAQVDTRGPGAVTANFGATSYAHTPPVGFGNFQFSTTPTVTLLSVPAGTLLEDYWIARVMAATTATKLVGFF